MIRNTLKLSCIFLAGIGMARAHEGHEHGAHEHGVGRLDIAVEKNTVDIDLDGPAVNLIGFEHKPADAKEKGVLDKAVADLKQGGGLIIFAPAAQCTQLRVKVASGLLEDGDGHDHDADEDHYHEGEAAHDHEDAGDDEHDHDHEHADINVTWEFTCAHPEAIREVDLAPFFKRFPDTRELRVQAVLPGGQTAAELTPKAARLKM